MTREEAIKGLLQSVEELYTHFWEGDDPRSNPVAFEVSECNVWLRIIQKIDEQTAKKESNEAKVKTALELVKKTTKNEAKNK